MKGPSLQGFKRFMQFVGVFLLGMVIGSIAYNMVFQASYNQL